jgi:hypothetical protein
MARGKVSKKRTVAKSFVILCNLLGILVFFVCLQLFVPDAKGAEKVLFIYRDGQSWKIRESSEFRMTDRASGKTTGTANRVEAEYRALRVYPDGSALVSSKVVKLEQGTTLKNLQPVDAGAFGAFEQYFLMTASGYIYLVQPMPAFDDPKEAEAMRSFGFQDEVVLLKKSPDTREWFALKEREPIDSYKLPAVATAVGSEAKRNGWTIKRLKDETVSGTPCQVYEAVLAPVVETAWFSVQEGSVLKRKTVQKGADGSGDAHVLRERLR